MTDKNDHEIVRVGEFESESIAIGAKAFLEEHDIQATLTNNEPSALGFSLEGEDAIDLFVSKSDFDQAKKLLEELQQMEEDPIPAWTCKCGEDVDEGFGVCWSCGSSYEPVTT